jgi:hypothetical protein
VISVAPGRAEKACGRAARIFTLALGIVATSWGAATIPIFWRQSSTEQVARHILAREPYTRQALASQLPSVELAEQQTYCLPAGVRSAAIIRFRMLEQAMADGDRSAIDGALYDAQVAMRRSLSCSPADPFLWLGLFWVTNAREGFNSKNFEFLRLSYELGPNEGWIAVTRNPIALAMFASLPDDIKGMAISEFLAFIKTGLAERAADIFIGPGWHVRDVLLTRMPILDIASRRVFAKSLHYRGYDDVNVPGVERPERQPWQH